MPIGSEPPRDPQHRSSTVVRVPPSKEKRIITTDQAQQLLGGDAVVTGTSGDKIGKVGQIYLDDQTGQPEWVTVKTGMFGSSESFVPLSDADVSGSDIQVPFTKDKVKDAPRVDADGDLSPDDEAQLYSYYGLGYSDAPSDSGLPTGVTDTGTDGTDTRTDRTDAPGTVGRDTSGPTTDDAMTRSEEQLHVGTERVQAGPGCASSSSPRTSPRRSRSPTRRSVSSGSRSPRPTAVTR